MSVDHRHLHERYTECLNTRAFDGLRELLTEDYEERYPQSGEVVRGVDNVIAVRRDYPGGELLESTVEEVRAAPGRESWHFTPSWTVVSVQESGASGTALIRARYPDGRLWWLVHLYELRGARLARSVFVFGEEFEQPEWRKGISTVEGR